MSDTQRTERRCRASRLFARLTEMIAQGLGASGPFPRRDWNKYGLDSSFRLAICSRTNGTSRSGNGHTRLECFDLVGPNLNSPRSCSPRQTE